MQHRRTKWVWIDGFSSGIWKWECFRTVESQQVESSRWMEQQQKKRDGPVRCVCEERQASEYRKSAEPEVVHGSVPARWDMLGVAVVRTLRVSTASLQTSNCYKHLSAHKSFKLKHIQHHCVHQDDVVRWSGLSPRGQGWWLILQGLSP